MDVGEWPSSLAEGDGPRCFSVAIHGVSLFTIE